MKNLRFINFIFCAFILGVFLNSCTVEKRRHRSGYYVNWNNNTELVSKEKEVIVEDQKTEVSSVEQLSSINFNPEISNINSLSFSKASTQLKTTDFKLSKKKKRLNYQPLLSKFRKYKSVSVDGVKTKKPERKWNWWGIASLLTLFLGPLALASVPLAIFAIWQFRRHPDKYKGIWTPILTLVLALVTILLFASFVILFSGVVGATSALGVLTILGLIGLAMILYLSLG